jgi:hypothetical protein
MNVDEQLSCLVSGARRPPIRVGIAHVADRPSVAVLSGCGSAVIGAGLDSRRALMMLHWNAALILAGSCCVIGWRGAPPGSCGPRQVSIPLGDSVAFGRRHRHRETGFAAGECP